MENTHVIKAQDLIKIFVFGAQTHLVKSCNREDIFLFREFLNEIFIDNEIPVRCEEVTERDIAREADFTYDVKERTFDIGIYLYKHKTSEILINYMIPLNITRWCTQAFSETM